MIINLFDVIFDQGKFYDPHDRSVESALRSSNNSHLFRGKHHGEIRLTIMTMMSRHFQKTGLMASTDDLEVQKNLCDSMFTWIQENRRREEEDE